MREVWAVCVLQTIWTLTLLREWPISRLTCRPSRRDFQLLKGVEIGLQDKSMSTIRKILADNKFDCVIASLHLIDGHDPYFGDYYRPYDWRYAYGHYLEEFDRLIRVMPDFDILGHYDYIVRYPQS